MKKSLLLILAVLAIFSCEKKQPQPEKQPGTEETPYVITTAEELTKVGELLKEDAAVYVELGADIDMADVKDFVPFNGEAPYDKQIHFDGKGFTISNFSCNYEKYPSLFGVLYGSCKNLNIDNASITSNGMCGVIGAYVGSAEKPAVLENVNITNSTVVNDAQLAGGVCGTALEATIKNVSFQGTVTSNYIKEDKTGGFVGQAEDMSVFENCSVEVKLTGYGSDIGGFAGKVIETVKFTGCKVKAEILSYALQKNRCGGFIGWNSSLKTVITDCHVLEGTTIADKSGRTGTAATNGNYAGFIGFGDTDETILEIKGCSAFTDINGGVSHYLSAFISCLGYSSSTTITDSYAGGTLKNTSGNQVGGFVGNVNAKSKVSIEGCAFSGSIEVSGGYVGGIVGGASGKTTIAKTYSAGKIHAVGAYVGGLIGAAMNDGNTITNCYSTAKVSAWGQQVGGLVGTTTNKLVMTTSYAAGDVYSTTSGAAGLVGRVQKSSSITNCIAWNKSVACSRNANNVYAPGGILGCAQEAGTYSGCWRRYDMVLMDDFIDLYDQDDFVDAMPPLPSYSTATHQQAYHGKAAPEGATLAEVAKSLKWDESVWNFASDDATFGFSIKQLGDNKIVF